MYTVLAAKSIECQCENKDEMGDARLECAATFANYAAIYIR